MNGYKMPLIGARRCNRAGVMIMLVGVLSVSLAACDSGVPVSPTATATIPAAQAPSTPAANVNRTPGIGSSEASPTPGVGNSEVTPTTVAQSTQQSTAQAAVCSKLNLNSLTEAELMATIPDFSSRMVREFFEYRPYASIQQFRREIGKYVDESQVAEWEKYVYVPVDPNNSDAETLKQIPGVDDAVTGELMTERPFASNEAFLAALGAKVSAQQLAGATCYLATSTDQ